jgi:Fe-S-cluster containining protein
MGETLFAEGLSFSCCRCSSCCRGAPGFVFLTASDLARLLTLYSLDFPSFFRGYCVIVDTGIGNALSLAEKRSEGGSYDCILWENGCSVYENRPIQCSTYPFWPTILESKESWLAERGSCLGIGMGETRDRDYIESMLSARRAERTKLFKNEIDPETVDAATILGREGINTDPADAGEAEE